MSDPRARGVWNWERLEVSGGERWVAEEGNWVGSPTGKDELRSNIVGVEDAKNLRAVLRNNPGGERHAWGAHHGKCLETWRTLESKVATIKRLSACIPPRTDCRGDRNLYQKKGEDQHQRQAGGNHCENVCWVMWKLMKEYSLVKQTWLWVVLDGAKVSTL